jgi:hypothetical protein
LRSFIKLISEVFQLHLLLHAACIEQGLHLWDMLLFIPLPQTHWHRLLRDRPSQSTTPALRQLVLLLASCWTAAEPEPEGRGYEHCEVLAECDCMLDEGLLLQKCC